MLENAAIADLLDEVADLLELKKGDSFRIRAYGNAARSVRTLGVRIADLVERGADLKQIPGIGSTIADEIRQMLATGTTERREKLREGVPPGLLELLRLPGIGPRKAWDLWTKAQIGSIADLRAAVESQRIRALPGMGEKTEESLRKALANVAPAESARLFFKDARAHLEAIGRHLDGIDAIVRWEAAGSYRRRRETIGDLDILIETKDNAATAAAILVYAGINEVLGRGEGGVRVKLADGLQVDFRFVEAPAFGAAQMYFTGSKAHNIELRQRAMKRKWKLSEYGLFDADEKRLAGKTEQSVYKKLGLPWIAPELREADGEIAAAEKGELPELIELADLRGDLHAHTNASDGRNTIEEMAAAARARGYEYLAITDHSKSLRIANGLDEGRMREHAARIREVGAGLDGFWLLAGIEVDILADGAHRSRRRGARRARLGGGEPSLRARSRAEGDDRPRARRDHAAAWSTASDIRSRAASIAAARSSSTSSAWSKRASSTEWRSRSTASRTGSTCHGTAPRRRTPPASSWCSRPTRTAPASSTTWNTRWARRGEDGSRRRTCSTRWRRTN